MTEKPQNKKDLFASVSVPEGLHADPRRAMKPCCLCGGQAVKRLYLQAHFPVVKCDGCKLVYADEHFRDADLQSFYSGDYYERAYVCHPAEIDGKIAADYVRSFERVDRALGGGRLLDFGSARATFLGELKKRGFEDRWQLEGVDINPDECRMGTEAGLDVHCGTIDEERYDGAEYDAITAFSVMEHLQDPVSIVERMAEVLRPGGELLFIVPAGDCLILDLAIIASRILGDRVRGFTDNVFHEEHLYYFTESTMKRLLEPRGFRVREFFYTPSYLETHPPSFLVGLGSSGLRGASWMLRKQTMLGVVATKA